MSKIEDGVLLEISGLAIKKLNSGKSWEEVFGKKTITELGRGVFASCLNLRNITIPESVTSISEFAFYNCRCLTKIIMPINITDIPNETFCDCTSLKNLIIPEGVASIGDYAISNCESLVNITIPNNVTKIGDFTFFCCKNLTTVTMSKNIKSIGESAFSGCKKLTSINLPKSIISIGERAFIGCENLISINLPESITSISNYTFLECTKLQNITIPKSVTSIGEGAFSGCKSLNNITIPEGIKKIEPRTFDCCKNLTKITIPESVTSIAYNAFSGCTNLKKIIIPKSVTYIGNNVFDNDLLVVFENRKIEECPTSANVLYIQKGNDVERINVDINIILNDKLQSKIIPEGLVELHKRDFNAFNNLLKIIKEKNDGLITSVNYRELMLFAANLGIFEDKDVCIEKEGKKIPVRDVAYTLLQGLFKKDILNYKDLHTYLSELNPGFNLEFLRFMSNKNNTSEFSSQKELNLIPTISNWFNNRKVFDLSNGSEVNGTPSEEKNRYKIYTYNETDSGVYKTKWNTPTVELLRKEILKSKYEKVQTPKDLELAEELSKNESYKEQKFYDKAKEILEEQKKNKVQNHILGEELKEGIADSLDEYRARTSNQIEQIEKVSKNILGKQKDIADNIFTYEMLSKSSLENFSMGFFTSCCAKLYGAGAGAQRAMMIHPDIQPIVIRNIASEIVCFGIIYVNRDKGYAVVNDFEMNSRYEKQESVKKDIYTKAIQGIETFVKKFNEKQEKGEIEAVKPITKVTCGLSPNGTRLNDFIKANKQSEILETIDFDDFKYAGSGSWRGDWFSKQYIIYDEGMSK